MFKNVESAVKAISGQNKMFEKRYHGSLKNNEKHKISKNDLKNPIKILLSDSFKYYFLEDYKDDPNIEDFMRFKSIENLAQFLFDSIVQIVRIHQAMYEIVVND